jgi:hypothetical protein
MFYTTFLLEFSNIDYFFFKNSCLNIIKDELKITRFFNNSYVCKIF